MKYGASKKGATLLDTLVGVALMLVVFVGITAVFQLSIGVVTNNKARTGALALSQERIEFIRSLSYNDIGTVGGIPSGDLEQTEGISLNGVSYTRTTLVRYIDDPKDGEGGADENDVTADSKEVKVTTSWAGAGGARSVALVSRVSPKGLEQAVPGGTIIISVRDASLNPVSSATVSIENTNPDPDVDVDVLTNENGEATFIGAPVSSGYEIMVSKAGHNSAQTYDADAQNPNPNPGHLTVAEGVTTASTFGVDRTGSITVETATPSGTTTIPLADIVFRMHSDKTIGTDGGGAPIYKYDETLDSESSARVALGDMEWGDYTISVDGAVIGYDIAESCSLQPITLDPEEAETVKLVLEAHTAHSLLVDVRNNSGDLISNAQVRLYRSVFDETQNTSACGQTFFSGLSEGTVGNSNAYSVDVTAGGYQSFSSVDDVDISGASRLSVVLNDI